MKQGYVHQVYLAWASGTDHYKIGFSMSPQVRLQKLQTGSFAELKLIKTFETLYPREDESYLHNLMGKYGIRGEWFQFPNEVMQNLNWFRSITSEMERQAKPRLTLVFTRVEPSEVDIDRALEILESLGVNPENFYLQCTLNDCKDNGLLQSALDFIVEDASEIYYEYPVDHAIHILYLVAVEPLTNYA